MYSIYLISGRAAVAALYPSHDGRPRIVHRSLCSESAFTCRRLVLYRCIPTSLAHSLTSTLVHLLSLLVFTVSNSNCISPCRASTSASSATTASALGDEYKDQYFTLVPDTSVGKGLYLFKKSKQIDKILFSRTHSVTVPERVRHRRERRGRR